MTFLRKNIFHHIENERKDNRTWYNEYKKFVCLRNLGYLFKCTISVKLLSVTGLCKPQANSLNNQGYILTRITQQHFKTTLQALCLITESRDYTNDVA